MVAMVANERNGIAVRNEWYIDSGKTSHYTNNREHHTTHHSSA